MRSFLLVVSIAIILVLSSAAASARTLPLELGPAYSGWTLQLLPGARKAGSALHRILLADGAGSLRQTILHRTELSAASWAQSGHLEDLDFDGYRDLVLLSEQGGRWSTYRIWRFDPRRGLFVENGLTRSMGRPVRPR